MTRRGLRDATADAIGTISSTLDDIFRSLNDIEKRLEYVEG